MIIAMNEEVLATGVGLTIAVVTLGVTIYLTNRSTQKIIDNSAKETRCLLDKLIKILDRTECTAAKTMFIGKCQLATQGYEIKENVEPDQAEKLGDVLGYDSKLKICACKPKEFTV